jgi:hypothetical protein
MVRQGSPSTVLPWDRGLVVGLRLPMLQRRRRIIPAEFMAFVRRKQTASPQRLLTHLSSVLRD